MPFTILINKNAGSVATQGEEEIVHKLSQAMNNQVEEIRFLESHRLHSVFKTIEPKGNTLLIGGGDGTLVSAATIFKERDIPFGLIPFGTMNLLCKDIGIPCNFLEAAAGYTDAHTVRLDTGIVNGRIFLCNAMIGIPSTLAREREERREEKSLFKWLRLFRNLLQKLSRGKDHIFTLKYEDHTEIVSAKAAIISNNPYSREPGTQNAFKKRSLQEGSLGIYTVTPKGTMESIHLLSSLISGNWQDDPCIETNLARSVEIQSHKRKILVLLDGEIHRLNSPLSFRLCPASLKVLVPADIKTKEAA